MKNRSKKGTFLLILLIVLVLSSSSVSAFSIIDFFNRVIFGGAIRQPTAQQIQPITVTISHAPLEPTITQEVIFTATTPYQVDEIKIYVNNKLVKTCTFAISTEPETEQISEPTTQEKEQTAIQITQTAQIAKRTPTGTTIDSRTSICTYSAFFEEGKHSYSATAKTVDDSVESEVTYFEVKATTIAPVIREVKKEPIAPVPPREVPKNLTNVTAPILGKNMLKYSKRQAFLISDQNWKEVLSLVPVGVWTEGSEIKKYPILIYHQESDSFDIDSIIHFMQMYKPNNLYIIGNTPQELDDILIADPEFGAGLKEEQIQRIYPQDYLSFWKSFNEIIYVRDNYKLALLASTYASLKNVPLIIQGSVLDTREIFENKIVTVIGARACPINAAKCITIPTIEELQKEYIRLTNTDKIILVNPNDLDIELNIEFETEKSTYPINHLFSKHSLAAPILAAAKHELIILVDVPESQNRNDLEIIENIIATDESLRQQILNLFETEKMPEYLTIIASPKAIPDSIIASSLVWASQADLYYAYYPKENLNFIDDLRILTDSYGNIILITDELELLPLSDKTPFYYTKLNNGGNVINRKKLSLPINDLGAVLVDQYNNVNIIYSYHKGGRENYTFYVDYAKLNSSGDIIINKRLRQFNEDEMFGVRGKTTIDLNNNIHIVWKEEDSLNYLHYMKLDNNGNILINKILDLIISGQSEQLNTDSYGNLHLISQIDSYFLYNKLDNNGNILIKDKILPLNVVRRYFSAISSADNNIHIIWSTEVHQIHYTKLDNNGNILINDTNVSKIFEGIWSLLLDSDFDDNVYIIWLSQSSNPKYSYNLYYTKLDNNGNLTVIGKEIKTTKTSIPYSYLSSKPYPNDMYIDLNNRLHFVWTDFGLNIYHKFYDEQWSEEKNLDLSQALLELKPGRIYGLNTADVSSYNARSIFYDEIVNRVYNEDEYTGMSRGIAFPSGREIAREIKIKTANSGYDSICFIDGDNYLPCEPDEASKQQPYPNISNYLHKQFIVYSDHGSPGGWMGFSSQDVPWLDLSYSFGAACSTNDFWQGKHLTFGPIMLRRGAMAYHGAMYPTGSGIFGSELQSMRKVTQTQEVSLGDLNSHIYDFSSTYRHDFIMLGDPTLKLKFKEVCWEDNSALCPKKEIGET